MMKKLDIVLYKNKNELVLITEEFGDKVRTIGHFGRTSGLGRKDLFVKISADEMIDMVNKNYHQKNLLKSYIIRSMLISEGQEHDLIDDVSGVSDNMMIEYIKRNY